MEARTSRSCCATSKSTIARATASCCLAAHFALIAMPWNVALWWQLMRLRVAVELDCDARVLRDADARSYGDLLLEVARPRRRLMLMGATAFAERASQLERRIRAIGRRRAHASRIARLGVAGIGVVVVTAAWVAPRPPAPARTSPRPVPPAPASASPRTDSAAVRTQRPALVDASSSPSAPARSVAAPERPRTTPSPSAQRDLDSVPRQTVAAPGVQDSAALATSPTLERRVVPGNTTVRVSTQLDLRVQQQDSIFEHLFAGIALTPDQEAKARDLVNQLEAAQIAQMANAIKALVAAAPLRQAMQAQADSGLEALLTNDADRALLHTRFAPQMAAGRGGGRSATLVGDTTLLIAAGRGARVGGGGFAGPLPGGGGGGGRGGARGGGGVGPTAAADAVELAFRRFFDGIPLTPQQQSDARVIIAKMQADIRATNPPIPGTIIARRGFSNLVTMSPESAAALASLLSNDGDRATLQSHIVIEVRRTIETPPNSAMLRGVVLAIGLSAALVVVGGGDGPGLGAQVDVIRGRVTSAAVDASPIANVSVTATSLTGNVNRAAKTDKDGRYTITFPGAEGDYFVTFVVIGYLAATRRGQAHR